MRKAVSHFRQAFSLGREAAGELLRREKELFLCAWPLVPAAGLAFLLAWPFAEANLSPQETGAVEIENAFVTLYRPSAPLLPPAVQGAGFLLCALAAVWVVRRLLVLGFGGEKPPFADGRDVRLAWKIVQLKLLFVLMLVAGFVCVAVPLALGLTAHEAGKFASPEASHMPVQVVKIALVLFMAGVVMLFSRLLLALPVAVLEERPASLRAVFLASRTVAGVFYALGLAASAALAALFLLLRLSCPPPVFWTLAFGIWLVFWGGVFPFAYGLWYKKLKEGSFP